MGENTNRSEPFFDEDVDLVKLQFTDIFGQAKNVAITASQTGKALNNQIGCINVSGSSVGFRAGKCSARDLPGLQCGWDAVLDGFASYFTGNGKTCREDGTGL